ncbi:MAG: hypothetical protein PV358_18945, partial [Acidimicrobiales bacterium]|nr:hypothetical protein [Acidimicrobiales bacterium]
MLNGMQLVCCLLGLRAPSSETPAERSDPRALEAHLLLRLGQFRLGPCQLLDERLFDLLSAVVEVVQTATQRRVPHVPLEDRLQARPALLRRVRPGVVDGQRELKVRLGV